MINLDFKIKPTNELLARRGLQPGGRVQKYIDSEVLRCSDPYVPFLSGQLKESGITSTIIGSGLVHYNTPYARKAYYKNRGNGIEGLNKGGKRGRLFFERMKADYGKDILRGAKRNAGAK